MRANLRLGNTVTSNNEKIPYRTYYRTVLPGRYLKKVTDKNADRSIQTILFAKSFSVNATSMLDATTHDTTLNLSLY
jgi:hypothetical protein